MHENRLQRQLKGQRQTGSCPRRLEVARYLVGNHLVPHAAVPGKSDSKSLQGQRKRCRCAGPVLRTFRT